MEKFKTELDKNHRFAVGVKIEGGLFAPMKSYATESQVSEGYREWYRLAVQKELHKPIAVKKEDDSKWDNARCEVLNGLMARIINEEDPQRN